MAKDYPTERERAARAKGQMDTLGLHASADEIERQCGEIARKLAISWGDVPNDSPVNKAPTLEERILSELSALREAVAELSDKLDNLMRRAVTPASVPGRTLLEEVTRKAFKPAPRLDLGSWLNATLPKRETE